MALEYSLTTQVSCPSAQNFETTPLNQSFPSKHTEADKLLLTNCKMRRSMHQIELYNFSEHQFKNVKMSKVTQ